MSLQSLYPQQAVLCLPNELLYEFVLMFPYEFTKQSVIARELHCRESKDWFEHFSKKHFEKRFVNNKNWWWHDPKLSRHMAHPEHDPLIVYLNELPMSHIKTGSVFGSRPLSAAFDHTYFEVKMFDVVNRNQRLHIFVGLMNPFGQFFRPEYGDKNLYGGDSFGCQMWNWAHDHRQKKKVEFRKSIWLKAEFVPDMAEGDIFGCGFLEEPPVRFTGPKEPWESYQNGRMTTPKPTISSTIIFTNNGKIIERLDLPPSIDHTQLHPFVMLSNNYKLEANFGQKPFCYVKSP